MQGIVVKFDAARGFGFIRNTKDRDKDVFVHISNIEGGKALVTGQKVKFEIEYTEKGPTALKVIPGSKQWSPYALFGLISLLLMTPIILLCVRTLSMGWLVAYFCAVNVATFIMYGYDKAAAWRNFLRVPEIVLHTLAFIGGTPMAFISQQFFRHKTVKTSFRIVFWLLLIVQIFIIWKIWSL